MRTEIRSRGGFTLVELLVSISVIALLIALALPGLASSFSTALRTKSLSNCRELAGAVGRYALSSDDLVPEIDENRFYPAGGPVGSSAQVKLELYATPMAWPVVLLDSGVIAWPSDAILFASPGLIRDSELDVLVPCDYLLSAALVADAAWWDPASLHLDERLLSAQRLSAVQHPAQKAMLYDSRGGWVRRELDRDAQGNLIDTAPVAGVDGAAAVRRQAEGRPAFPKPAHVAGWNRRWEATVHGVRGVDW